MLPFKNIRSCDWHLSCRNCSVATNRKFAGGRLRESCRASISFDPTEFPFRMRSQSRLGPEREPFSLKSPVCVGAPGPLFFFFFNFSDMYFILMPLSGKKRPVNFHRFIYNYKLIWDHHLFPFISIAKEKWYIFIFI